MDPKTEEKRILEIIFKHLAMFEYYKDLKEYEKCISSLWSNEPSYTNKIDHTFLRMWLEKCAIEKSENTKLERLESRSADDQIEQWTMNEFIKHFSRDSGTYSKESFGEVAEVPDAVNFLAFPTFIIYNNNIFAVFSFLID